MSTTIQEAPPVAEPVRLEPIYPEFLRATERLSGETTAKKWQRKDWHMPCVMQSLSPHFRCGELGERLNDEARRLGFVSAEDAFAWNDHPDRTLSEVLERLTLAAYGEFEG